MRARWLGRKAVALFQATSTTDASEAADLLMTAATTVPELTPLELRQEFEDIKGAWGCKTLEEGDAATVRDFAGTILAWIGNREGCRGFEVRTYPSQRCAQASVLFVSHFVGVRVWKTESGYAACTSAQ